MGGVLKLVIIGAGVIIVVMVVLAGIFFLKRNMNMKREARDVQGAIRLSGKGPAGAGTRFTVLVENNIREDIQNLRTAHGISLYAERKGVKFLLDLGPGDEFSANAAALGRNIAETDFVFISHGHYDHGGGLTSFLEKNRMAPIYLSRRAVEERHAAKIAGVIEKNISLDAELAKKYPGRFKYIDKATEISRGVFVIPVDARAHPLPSGNAILFRESAGSLVPDDFSHELVLVIRDAGGLIVFSGCCHNGVLNVIDAVNKNFPGVPVKAVIGGFHLFNPVTIRMDEKAEDVAELGRRLKAGRVERFYSGHCTGMEAFSILKKELGGRLEYFSTGMEFSL